jgi:hypothetical protein
LSFAEPHGQIQDWALSLADGSRLHVHVRGNGTKYIHRDATDPSISPFHAAWHVATETSAGPIVIGIAAFAAAAVIASRKANQTTV